MYHVCVVGEEITRGCWAPWYWMVSNYSEGLEVHLESSELSLHIHILMEHIYAYPYTLMLSLSQVYMKSILSEKNKLQITHVGRYIKQP